MGKTQWAQQCGCRGWQIKVIYW